MALAGGVKVNARDVLRSIAFYAAFYLGTVVYVFAALVTVAGGGRGLRRVVIAWSRYHRACAGRLLAIRVEVMGTPPPPGALLAIKHESFFEAIDLPLLFDGCAIFAKAELLRIPLWGRVATAYGLIGVERTQGARALRTMLTAARAVAGEGRPLAIFPEGTRTPHGLAPPLQSGFSGLYKVLGVPVVPVAVDSGLLYHAVWKRPGTIQVRIGDPIPAGLPRAEIEARVRDAINALNPVTAG